MSNAIARLKLSKARHQSTETDRGKKEGRDWAEHNAEYEDLKALHEIREEDITQCEDADEVVRLMKASLPDYVDVNNIEFISSVFGKYPYRMSHYYIVAFIEGAQEFYGEVKDEIED